MSAETYLEKHGHRKYGAKAKPPEERHYKCARDVLRKGKTVFEALVTCGYAEKQAAKGLQVVKRVNALRVAFQEESAKIEKELAEAPLLPNSWNAREQLILTRLEKNIKAGKDGGALSAKLLGSHKALNLWEVDSRTGVIIVNAPGAAVVGRAHLEVSEDPE